MSVYLQAHCISRLTSSSIPSLNPPTHRINSMLMFSWMIFAISWLDILLATRKSLWPLVLDYPTALIYHRILLSSFPIRPFIQVKFTTPCLNELHSITGSSHASPSSVTAKPPLPIPSSHCDYFLPTPFENLRYLHLH